MDKTNFRQQFIELKDTKTKNSNQININCLSVSLDRKTAVTGFTAKQPELVIWDTVSLKIKAQIKLPKNSIALSFCKFSRNAQYVFCVDRSSNANLYCFKTSDLSLIAR